MNKKLTTTLAGKVFEIGDPKTGTASLGKAFRIVGLKHIGFSRKLHAQCRKGEFEETLKVAEKYDAFKDGPWHNFNLYKTFDKKFPGSKFILLQRDIQSWIKSHEYHFSTDKNSTAFTPIFNYQDRKQGIIDKHVAKYDEIKKYFRGRPDDLLVMNICAGEGWEKLCPFLGLPVPKRSFPHANNSNYETR